MCGPLCEVLAVFGRSGDGGGGRVVLKKLMLMRQGHGLRQVT